MSSHAKLNPIKEMKPSVLATADRGLVMAIIALLGFGLIMVASTSVAVAENSASNVWHYFQRQLAFAGLAIVVASVVIKVPTSFWLQLRGVLLLAAIAVLLMVWLPVLGHTVNGSSRWIDLGMIKVQASEPARLMVIMYLASYLVQRRERLQTHFSGVAVPLSVLLFIAMLMLGQPDFGAAVVLLSAGFAMMWLGGLPVRWLIVGALVLTVLAVLAVNAAPYRVERLLAAMDPWADPYGRGYQTVQALIAVGSGGVFGNGLGNSIQKIFYLPEVHTDFVYAIIAEELGLLGMAAVLGMYAFLLWRAFVIADKAVRQQNWYGALLVSGLSVWLGLQVVIHAAVNLGGPPKGTTLPLISYGGSSLLVMMTALALIIRVSYEINIKDHNVALKQKAQKSRLAQTMKEALA